MMRTRRFVGWSIGLVAVGMLGVAVAQEVEQKVAPPNTGLTEGGQALTTQRRSPAECARGHYKTLLKTIDVPADQASYGDFCDYGYWAGTSYGGQDNLPTGYWVYLAPKWYIFGEAVGGGSAPPAAQAPRAWGPEQATGAPDTWPNAGDLQSAWASATPDGQREWLELTYDAPLRPSAVLIYETYNPGAVDRVTAYNAEGKEFDLWTGTDPTPAGTEKGISVIAVHPEMDISRIRIYLDSPKVSGWNEIDAVGLLDAAGTTHWAKSATASSTYADATTHLENLGVPETTPRLRLFDSAPVKP